MHAVSILIVPELTKHRTAPHTSVYLQFFDEIIVCRYMEQERILTKPENDSGLISWQELLASYVLFQTVHNV